jgi:threonine dehydratase
MSGYGDSPGLAVSRAGIESVAALIGPRIRRTPVIRVDRADFGLPPGPLVLKLEQLQHTGSFKARGALANLLLRQVPSAGVVAASGGNHGAAVAYAAHAEGVKATIFVPEISSPAKVARIRSYGADLVVTGQTYADALAASQEWTADRGALQIHAFDQPETMLGAGTLALELERQAPDVTTVIAPVGGGGLLGGVAAGYAGAARMVAAEPAAAPTLARALAAGRPVDAPVGGIAADSLAPARIGERNYPVLAAYVSEVILVSDDEIAAAQQLLWDWLRLVAEPGGSAALAALLSGRLGKGAADDDVPAVVISGANTTAVDFGPRQHAGASP